jgi:hypothetical protein
MHPGAAVPLALIIALSVASGCAQPAASAPWRELCHRLPDSRLFARTELFFGLSKPGGQVTDEEFQRFVDEQVTPRFPDGLTVLAGEGRFKGDDGAIVEEGSRLLILLYPFSRASHEAIERIRAAYLQAFGQQSVLRVDEAACVSF